MNGRKEERKKERKKERKVTLRKRGEEEKYSLCTRGSIWFQFCVFVI